MPLKIEKNYNVIRLLYFIENQLYIALKKRTQTQRASKHVKKNRDKSNAQREDLEAGYPEPSDKENTVQNKATA